MDRIAEPQLMDDPLQAQAYADADFSEPHQMFVEQFRANFPEQEGHGYALDLGCGPADIAIRFARAYPNCCLHGIDGAPNMLRLGRRAIATAQLSERIVLFQGVLPEAVLPRTSYDIVISNSLLHHLSDPLVLWHSIKRLAKPDALIMVMDLVRPAHETDVKRLVDSYAASAPPVLQRDFHRSLLAAYEVAEVKAQLAKAEMRHLHVQVVSDRHLIVVRRG
jgi:ubiquinone/menaquinone biosynthesis C-methylase UbiE